MERLRDVLVGMLVDAGDAEAALGVRRAEFERRPAAAGYRSLVDMAVAAGAPDVTPWALGVLRDRVAGQPAYAGALIEVLVAAGHDDQAWLVGVERRERLGERQWLALLERRARTSPREVVGPYEELVEARILDSADKRRYQRALALLHELRAAYAAAGDPTGFRLFLDDLRVRHARRPTLLKTLDAAGL